METGGLHFFMFIRLTNQIAEPYTCIPNTQEIQALE